jgi:hypothetical protein
METMMLNTALTGLFSKKLSKVNTKAAKLGMAGVDVEFGATVEQPCGSDTIAAYQTVLEGKKCWVALYTEVVIMGEAPVINGYRLVAVVDLRGSKPVVRKAPHSSDADLSPYFETDCRCDHCNTFRARNDVLVVQSVETGELMQIGRNCANDFFGTKDAKQRLAVSDWIDTYGQGSESDNLPQGELSISVRRLFETAAAVVRKFGWVNHKDCTFDNTLTSTKSRVWQNLFPYMGMPPEDYATVTAEDVAEAAVVLAWLDDKFLSKAPADCGDFERTIQAVVEGEGETHVRFRNLNYLIWGIAGYKRDLQKDAEERRRKAELVSQVAASEYVGSPGKRENFALTLTFKRAFGSDYGVRYMQKFTDVDGNVVVWWGTNDTAERTVVGNAYVFKATVKEHTEYDGVKQTVLTRAALVEGELAEGDDA